MHNGLFACFAVSWQYIIQSWEEGIDTFDSRPNNNLSRLIEINVQRAVQHAKSSLFRLKLDISIRKANKNRGMEIKDTLQI